jgi:hypothetical protein
MRRLRALAEQHKHAGGELSRPWMPLDPSNGSGR